MSFSTFNISELPEDADDDYAIEFTTKHSKIGITLSEQEARGVGDGLLRTIDEGVDSLGEDGQHVSEL